MFIRWKRNKSGSISVHIVRKEGGHQVHVLSIGTATNEKELVKLEQVAMDKLSALQLQNRFEFSYAEDRAFIQNLQSSIEHIEVSVIELILGKLFNEIGFNQIKEPLFRHLVLSRICYPGSKLKTVEYLLRHHQLFYEIDAVYRYLDKVKVWTGCIYNTLTINGVPKPHYYWKVVKYNDGKIKWLTENIHKPGRTCHELIVPDGEIEKRTRLVFP